MTTLTAKDVAKETMLQLCRNTLTTVDRRQLTIDMEMLNSPKFLKQQGYRTAHIGKWHLGFGETEITNCVGEIKLGAFEIGFDYHVWLPNES